MLREYSNEVKTEKTNKPVTKPLSGQAANNGGGFSFVLGDRERLERFLILGVDNGSYYVGRKQYAKSAIDHLKKMIKTDERLVVDLAMDISTNARAFSNSPALFAIALVMVEGQDKAYARAAVQKIARTSTHLFEYAQYIDDLGGWGRAKRQSVADWYTSKDADDLAYQAVKYRQRNGWTHRDLFRLSHPTGVNTQVGGFILGNGQNVIIDQAIPEVLIGFKKVQEAETTKDVLSVLGEYKQLSWEAIPTQFHKEAAVWETLFYNGQLRGQALVRNVVRLSRLGAFNDVKFAGDYAKALTDEKMIQKTRLHPINFLNASVVYREGQVNRNGGYSYSTYLSRNQDWSVNPKIAAALDEGFYLAFKYVEPANARTLVAVDVSGSMDWEAATGSDLSSRQVAGAMAMTIARTEPYADIRAFSSELTDLKIGAKDDLATVMRKVNSAYASYTNIALPMEYAIKNKLQFDTFVVITDNEVNAGRHPQQALNEYRQKFNPAARLVVLGTTATEFTVGDPKDAGVLNLAGFDSNAPKLIADFSAGRL
jgi:60 kDa SS-A/Ro ribonucleoprotein